MSETFVRHGGPRSQGRVSGSISKAWSTVRAFYRIRPIPGVSADAGSNTISFDELFREFVADWRVLMTGIGLGVLVAALLVNIAAPTYEATLTVAPTESNMSDSSPTTGGTSLLNIFGKGTGQYDDFAQFLDMTHSVRLASRLNVKYDLMKTVFPFNKKKDAFIPPPAPLPRLTRALRWAIGLQPWAPPNMVSLSAFLEKAVQIKNESDGVAVLSYHGRTPTDAGSFLAHIYQETDKLMREEKLASHQKRLEYLAQRLSNTSSVEQRNFLIGLWGREQSQMLLLTGGDPVGARMTDDIHVPNMPQNGAGFTLGMGLLFGLLTGMFAVIGRSAYRRA